MNPICITFAGAVGSSKTPIANYLSTELLLPIYNNDAVRTEVIEELGFLDQGVFLKRRDERIQAIVNKQTSFILDASVDRTWSELKPILQRFGYKAVLISLDLTKEHLQTLYERKGYMDSLALLDNYVQDHLNFLEQYGADVTFSITTEQFAHRLALAKQGVDAAMGRG